MSEQQKGEQQQQFKNILDDEVEFRDKKLPRVYQVMEWDEKQEQWFQKDLKAFVETPDYRLSHLFMKSADDTKVIWTHILAEISPQRQLKPVFLKDEPNNHNLKYFVVGGRGLISVSDRTRAIRQNCEFTVEKGVHHNIINTDEFNPLTITIDYEGLLDLRDRYYPQEYGKMVSDQQMNQILNVKNSPGAKYESKQETKNEGKSQPQQKKATSSTAKTEFL